MATLTVQELAARYRLAAHRQALVERFRAAATTYRAGQRVKVRHTHNFPEWRGEGGTIDKYVPFGKYYVVLDTHGRVLIDESYLAPMDVEVDDVKDAAFTFLRESRLSWLVMGMAEEARKAGERFGFKDSIPVFKAWFAGDKASGPKEEAGYRYIESPAGQLLLNGVIKGVMEALKSVKGRVGFKDVGSVIIAFIEDK
jgi:hypothetical protein